MHKRYNIIATIISFSAVLLLPVQGQSDFFYDIWQPNTNSPATSDLAGEAVSVATSNDGIFVQLIGLFGLNNFIANNNSAVAYIQYIINMLLWLAAFIALIILLYGFYLMFFSTQEEWFDKAKKIIIWVIVALFIMWLSWVIVSFLFYLYSLIQ
jgi:uncharacterized membrane protein